MLLLLLLLRPLLMLMVWEENGNLPGD